MSQKKPKGSSHLASGSKRGSQSGGPGGLKFKTTYTIEAIGLHKATIVWLHDVGQKGLDGIQPLRQLGHPNIKWILLTAPIRRVTSLGGEETTAWCDLTKVSENMQDDIESLNHVNTYIANILASEPGPVMKGIGGIGLGAAQALYFASCYAFGRIPIDLQVVIGINGWLPGWRNLEYNMNTAFGTAIRASKLQILILQGTSDDVVPSEFAYNCADLLRRTDFPTMFKQCGGDHVMNEIKVWLTQLGI